MKNCKSYYDNDLQNFIGNLWVSDEFKDAFKNKHPFLDNIIQKACKYPIYFYQPSDDIERSHFSTFWRHIPLREYNNPVVNDLYYLHELAHLAHMDYKSDVRPENWNRWETSMIFNEFFASMDSEVFVYLHFPTLRSKTFNFEIWVDRFLKQGATDSNEWRNRLYQERNIVMYGVNENRDDIEKYIHHYAQQNKIWADIWRNSFYKINRQVTLFQNIFNIPAPKSAIEGFKFFIEDNTISDVPFRYEAEQFNNFLGGNIKTDFKV